VSYISPWCIVSARPSATKNITAKTAIPAAANTIRVVMFFLPKDKNGILEREVSKLAIGARSHDIVEKIICGSSGWRICVQFAEKIAIGIAQAGRYFVALCDHRWKVGNPRFFQVDHQLVHVNA
jgi:hypothetical protein